MPTILTAADLAQLVAAVSDSVPAADAGEGAERLRQFEALKGAVAAMQMREAVALAQQRIAEDAVRGVPAARRGRGTAGEIGLARRISPNQAQRWLGLARILPAELPATFDLLSRGKISERRAMLIAKETIFLSREHRAAADAELAPRLAGLGDAGVESAARRVAQRLDPAGAAERARNATKDRRVSLRPAPDTMARLSLLIPVHQGVAGYAALRRHADALIAIGAQGTNPDGTTRTRDQVMADAAIERLTGQAVADAVPVEISLIMSDATLFGTDDDEADSHRTDTDGSAATSDAPAVLLGYGPIPAPLARDLALGRCTSDDRTSDDRTRARRWIRRLFVTPDGKQLAAMDSSRREFTENQARFIRLRDQGTCRTPWCDAPIRHIDHVDDHARGGRTAVPNGQGYCVACNLTKQTHGWRTVAVQSIDSRSSGSVIVTITPTGHRYESYLPAPPGVELLMVA